MVQGHLDICGYDGDEERDKAPGGESLGCWEEEACAAQNLADATDLDEQAGRWQVGGHDPEIDRGQDEVECASDDEDYG